MAFKLDVPTPFGITAGYHKITEIRVDFLKREAVIVIGGWKNRADANLGTTPLASSVTGVGKEDFDFAGGEVDRARAYSKARSIKSRGMDASGDQVEVPSKWAGAVDELEA